MTAGRLELGSQIPTTAHIPKGRRDEDCLRLAEKIGLNLDPWQADILADSSRTIGDRWSAFECAAIVPRQNGKSYLILARALAGVLLYEEKLILYSAHEYRTAQETWRIMRDLCESDALKPYVKRLRIVAGGESVEFHNGARFKLIARTRSSGRGFSPDTLLLDEGFALSGDVIASVIPSMAARPNPQVYYFSSAGTWESEVLLGLRRRGHAKTARNFGYWEWHAEATDEFEDPRIHRKANPAYGIRISPETIIREFESMSTKTFGRERLGVWTETATEAVLREQDLSTVDVPAPPRDGRPIGWGIDVSMIDRSGAAIAAAFHDDNGNAVLVLIDSRPGAGWLPGRLAELNQSYEFDAVAYDHHGGLIDLMERAERDFDVPTQPLRHAQYPVACANLAQRVAEGTLRFAAAPPLLTDAGSASARHTTSGWVWDRKVVTPPTNLIAATCALYALEHAEGGSTVAVY